MAAVQILQLAAIASPLLLLLLQPVAAMMEPPAPAPVASSSPGVTLDVQEHQVLVDNGVVRVLVSKPQGQITGVWYAVEGNLLHFDNSENSGGYWDVVWNFPGSGFPDPTGMIDMLDSTEFRVVSSSEEEQVELSFRSTYDPSRPNSVRLTVDKRLVMLKGSSGFYCYAIFEHANDWPALNITEARLVFKLDTTRFNYMAVSDEIQRYMPTAADREPPRGMPLAYKEAVLMLNPADPQFKGEVDDKYQYSLDNKDNRVHGWIGDGPVPVGFWVITPSNEFKSGGPLKRELTSHTGPTSLTMFLGTHYVGNAIVAKIGDGEPWKKVLGPVFIYLNSNPVRGDFRSLWEDAKVQAEAEASKWPYHFPESPYFQKADERGSVTGRLLVRDKYMSSEDMPARLAYVGLAAPGQPGSWATESKGYQFWTRTTESCGSFAIGNVRAGEYNLYAWVPGFLGDYMYAALVTVVAGGTINLRDLVFEPPRSGPTLWDIGMPDRSANEFFVPDPNPKYLSKLFLTRDRYRQYGLWERYADLYPDDDPVFTVGESNYSKDFFFAHVTRNVGGDINATTTRRFRFNLDHLVAEGTYTLRVALAAAHISSLQVQVNVKTKNGSEGVFTTPEFGENNAIMRHSEHGTWCSFEFPIKGYQLMEGENSINITQVRTFTEFLGVMYDYIRLEGPPSSWRDPTR